MTRQEAAREEGEAPPENESLIVAMAEKCSETIRAWGKPGLDQPTSLRPEHIEWMCREIERHATDWPATKIHRWLGFVQGAMIANKMIRLEDAKRMFDEAKNAFGANDQDLVDHLDAGDAFELDIGGQG